MINPQMTDLI